MIRQRTEREGGTGPVDGYTVSMTSDLEQARAIAERIARRVSGSSAGETTRPGSVGYNREVAGELAAMRAGLNDLQKRLTQIEAKVRESGTASGSASRPITEVTRERRAPLTHSPWLAGVNASVAHPSQERFGVEEATVTELVDFFEKEKTCGIEPGGKPCDHCAMCSTRGF